MPPLSSPNFTLRIGVNQKKKGDDNRFSEKQGSVPSSVISWHIPEEIHVLWSEVVGHVAKTFALF